MVRNRSWDIFRRKNGAKFGHKLDLGVKERDVNYKSKDCFLRERTGVLNY